LVYISQTLGELNKTVTAMQQDKRGEPDEYMENREATFVS